MSRKPLFSKAMPPAERKRRSRLGLAKPTHKKRSKGLGTRQTLAPSAPVGTAASVHSERDDEIDRIVLDAACDELLRRFQEAMADRQLGIADRRHMILGHRIGLEQGMAIIEEFRRDVRDLSWSPPLALEDIIRREQEEVIT